MILKKEIIMCMLICLIAALIAIYSNRGRISILSIIYTFAAGICFIENVGIYINGGNFVDTSISNLFNGVLIVLGGVAFQLILEIGFIQFLRNHYSA